ncbi:terminase TerL endonuclease subunit [Romboutsia ilealis]|uniref:terminase TerL endonuclease subunit n=1 Tax=Romboutsia ilealis TaxID=1115758 RepID=UPI00272C60B9|nr:terminase TerL endonuclease subunit [Romboutsia ilealis]
MDFLTAPCIMDALKDRLEQGIFGYTTRPYSYNESIVNWLDNRFSWKIKQEWLMFSPAVITSISLLIQNLTQKNDKIMIQEPVYSPFHSIVESNERDLVISPLVKLDDGSYDSMETRDQPIFFETSTMGTTRENVFDGEYDYASNVINTYEDPSLGFVDETLLPIIYELDSKKEWTNEKCWEKANPGLGTIKKIKGIRDKVARAKIKPDELKNLLCKDFNVRETSVSSWLSYEDLNNDATYNLAKMKVRYGIGGTDLSSTTDLTAAKVIFMLPNDPIIYAMQQYWLPEELLEQKIKEDKIPYDKWLERGLLRLCPGNKIHPKEVTKWFLEVRDDYGIYLPWIGYDAWSAEYWVEEMKGNFGEEAMIEVHQGKKTLSAPMKNLGADLKSKLINYNNNPIDKWCLSNTNVDTDRNGNIQPDKGRNARLRIDGMSALLDAYVVLEKKKNDYLNMI